MMNKFFQAFANSSRDVKLLYLLVFVRMFSYSMSNQVIIFFFKKLHITDNQIGTFLGLTLLGDVIISYFLTWYADYLKRRNVLIYGAVMMFFSGLIFSIFENYYILLFGAIIGIISSGDEVGPFKSIEESMIAHLTPHHDRPEVYSMHSLFGTIGGSIGSVFCGYLIDYLIGHQWIGTYLKVYKFVFLLYGLTGLLKLVIMLFLSEQTNLNVEYDEIIENSGGESEPLLVRNNQDSTGVSTSTSSSSTTAVANVEEITEQDNKKSMTPHTIAVMKKLLVVFMLDSFGYGITANWLLYYYESTFQMTFTALGILFSVTKVITGISTIPSSVIARLFGPVKATLLVQITSAVFFILIPFLNHHQVLSIGSLNVYFATMAMDVTPRQIILTNIIDFQHLTQVMGIVNMGKTLARSLGQFLSGYLVNKNLLWFCFILSGSLTILADVILGVSFIGLDKKILKRLNRK